MAGQQRGCGGTKIADLTKPLSYTAGKMTFTAPAGTTLSASTTYHVVFYTSPRGTGSLRLRTTSSDNEDSGAADAAGAPERRIGKARVDVAAAYG